MPCPQCQNSWRRVVGKYLSCSQCGHRELTEVAYKETKCLVCKKVYSSLDANNHKTETGHNEWELL